MAEEDAKIEVDEEEVKNEEMEDESNDSDHQEGQLLCNGIVRSSVLSLQIQCSVVW